MRPALILLYSLIMYCLECQRVPKHKQKAQPKDSNPNQSLSDSDASGQMDGSYMSSSQKHVQAYRVHQDAVDPYKVNSVVPQRNQMLQEGGGPAMQNQQPHNQYQSQPQMPEALAYSFDDTGSVMYLDSHGPDNNKNYGQKGGSAADQYAMMKKVEKKRSSFTRELLLMLPFMMYAGAARHMLTFDNKRKFVKMAQV